MMNEARTPIGGDPGLVLALRAEAPLKMQASDARFESSE